MEGNLTFRGAYYSLSGIWIAECLEISDVGCNLLNLKQFCGLT